MPQSQLIKPKVINAFGDQTVHMTTTSAESDISALNDTQVEQNK